MCLCSTSTAYVAAFDRADTNKASHWTLRGKSTRGERQPAARTAFVRPRNTSAANSKCALISDGSA